MTRTEKRAPEGARNSHARNETSANADAAAAFDSSTDTDSLHVNDQQATEPRPASGCTLAIALQYARHGVRLLPLHSVRADGSCTCGDPHDGVHGKKLKPGSIGKHPRINEGFDASSTDPKKIKDWFVSWPVMNLGGFPPPGVVIVDIDPRNGGVETWQRLRAGRGGLQSPRALTGGGGWHLWVRAHATRSTLGAGIDLKKDRGYVVLPPSNHVKGAYRWAKGLALGQVEIVTAPDWLQSAMVETKSSDHDDGRPTSLLDQRGTERDLILVLDALKHLRSTDRTDWVNFGAAMRRAFRHDQDLEARARAGWTLWSIENCDDPEAVATEEECEATWETIDTNPSVGRPIRIGTIIWRAKQRGWIPEHQEVHPDEKGNARWLVRYVGDQYLTSAGASKDLIYAWTGLCWQLDVGHGRIYITLEGLTPYWQQRADEATDDEARAVMLKHAMACRKWPVLTNTIKHIVRQRELLFDRRKFDAKPALLGCTNGVLDLATGQLHPHAPEFLLTKLVDVEFDPQAECPQFKEFITESLGGDGELVDFVQRVLGYVLSGHTGEQLLFFLLGPSNTGKSTLVALLRDLLGVYCYTLDSGAVMQQRSGANYSMANIPGTRLVVVNELPRGQQFNAPLLKQLSGEDEIEARMIYEAPLRFVPTCKIILVGNERPVVPPGEDAFWRRVVVVPFDHVVPPAERDPRLVEKLRAEVPGILAWVVRGHAAWRARGLSDRPAAVRAAIDDYRAEADPVMRWHDACCKADATAKATLHSDLRTSYLRWCGVNGVESISEYSFANWLASRGYATGRTHRGRVRKGVRLSPARVGD